MLKALTARNELVVATSIVRDANEAQQTWQRAAISVNSVQCKAHSTSHFLSISTGCK